MNDKFKKIVKQSGKTLYTISKESGIPYSTLNELMNEKGHINKCSAETVFKLSLFFKCTLEELLDPMALMANVSGKYHNIKYKWIAGKDTMELHIWDNGIEKIIDNTSSCNQVRFYHSYISMTKAIIDVYLENSEAERMLLK